MIIIFIHRGLRPDNELQKIICERIERLAKRLHIEVAEVTLERNGQSDPTFTARLHLATAGEDYCAESRDRTMIGAIDKVLAKLSIQIHPSSDDLLPGGSVTRAAKSTASSWNQLLFFAAA